LTISGSAITPMVVVAVAPMPLKASMMAQIHNVPMQSPPLRGPIQICMVR
jgi:hypothetical protein